MRTVTVSHNWYSFLRCSGIAVPTVFGAPSDVSCQDRGRTCRAWSGLVGMEAELGHSLTRSVLAKLLCVSKQTTPCMWNFEQVFLSILSGSEMVWLDPMCRRHNLIVLRSQNLLSAWWILHSQVNLDHLNLKIARLIDKVTIYMLARQFDDWYIFDGDMSKASIGHSKPLSTQLLYHTLVLFLICLRPSDWGASL